MQVNKKINKERMMCVDQMQVMKSIDQMQVMKRKNKKILMKSIDQMQVMKRKNKKINKEPLVPAGLEPATFGS